MKQKGLFIVLEGTDGSGKATQSELLKKRLEQSGHELLIGDFPRYETSESGKLVGKFLKGEFGKLEDVDPYLTVLPYMIDEYTWSRDVARPWIEKGGIILSNRYFTSNIHQIAKKKGRARGAYRSWIWNIGYKELGILRPDLVLFLDVPPMISKKLVLQKFQRTYLGKKKKDIAERSFDHQVAAYQCYQYEVLHNDWWTRVPCVTTGGLDSVEKIHEKIWKVTESYVISIEEPSTLHQRQIARNDEKG